MQKILIYFSIFFLFNACSFDNKTGIWSDATKEVSDEKKDIRKLKKNKKYKKDGKTITEARYKAVCKWGIFNPPECDYERINDPRNEENIQFVNVFQNEELFEEEILKDTKIKINIIKSQKNKNWLQTNYSSGNSIPNLHFSDKKDVILKSSKLSRSTLNSSFLYFNDSIVYSDQKGSIYVYSVENKEKSFKFNFYQKKYKKFKKKIYLLIHNKIIFAADNLGYVYAIDINSKKLIWAKNFGIPFRSNIKVANNQLLLASQDNVLFSLDVFNGVKNWEIASSVTYLKSAFENSIVIDQNSNNLFFLNTSGELYSINYETKNINWVLNFKSSSAPNEQDLFLSHPMVLRNNLLSVTTNKSIFTVNSITGSKIWRKAIPISTKPLVTKNYTFVITKNNFLMCIDNSNGNVLWSRNIFKQINEKKVNKLGAVNDFNIVESAILISSFNGYLISANYQDGSIISYKRLSRNGIKSKPIFANGYMYVLNGNNKILKIE
jgi:outer membrane protein assembly factor BamB